MTDKRHYDVLDTGAGKPVKLWTRGVPVEGAARQQLVNTAQMPFIFRHLAVMPDVHLGKGSTIGSVIPTVGAVIPAAVGVDIGCGMIAAKTSLRAEDLPLNLGPLRSAIERAIPHGRGSGKRDPGAWNNVPEDVDKAWAVIEPSFRELCNDYPSLKKTNNRIHLGTMGTGNHYGEVCLDEEAYVWLMLHSGSRGVGNAIGSMFIELAKKDAMRHDVHLPDQNLAYLEEGSKYFRDYVRAVGWAQEFARLNRELMMRRMIGALRTVISKPFQTHIEAVNCHHNYVQREMHFGQEVYVTRKGAVRAGKGEMGIIPGSMGTHSFIVSGKGNPESFESCSHGAGRLMSRSEAKRRFTVEDLARQTAGVECRKDPAVIDEAPEAYKDVDAVMRAQADLVEVVHTLKQIVCVKG
ncbi:RtcB family protein [Cupriavidus sp. TMH.W2]|uniref:RtcB family protein n=1 Tax=Cupriavidus sp. TMH.W2 TaxID=3434465 RepID=UPI003D78AC27